MLLGIVVSGCASAGGAPGDARPAILHLALDACPGTPPGRATAVVIGEDLVATVAHPFATASGFELLDAEGRAWPARVESLDLDRDLAVLRLESPAAVEPLVSEPAQRTGDAEILSFPSADEGVVRRPITVTRVVTATLDGEGSRLALELGSAVEAGESGSAVLDGDGRLIGLVFAGSRQDERGWAVASQELEALRGDGSGGDVRLGC